MVVLCNIAVVEIGDPQIQDDIKQERKVQDDKIGTLL